MAINPSTNPTMAGRITAVDLDYPYGSAKDETAPGAGDGSPYFKARADDLFGFMQALLRLASIVPTGNADTARASQYVQAVEEIAAGRAVSYDESGIADAYILDLRTNQQGPASYFNGMCVEFMAGNANAGASTVNVAGLGSKTIKNRAGVDLIAGDINTKTLTALRFDLANDWFVADYVDIRAIAFLNTTQSIPNNTGTVINYNDEAIDNGGIHDNVTNNSRMTVPAGFTKAQISCSMTYAVNATGSRAVQISKNGLTTYAGRVNQKIEAAGSSKNTNILSNSPILDVVGGDYFEASAEQVSGAALDVSGDADGRNMWIEMRVW